ncbi:cell division septum initiation protein DivIVA [Desulfitispora alkaliphila]|uniref:ATPase n=1 Tax=Desulfitispora alkaliphila TaxID=622674 RepID=UPI003D1E8659
MELIKLLEEFEHQIESGTKIPITGKVLIDEEVILDYLDQLRAILPEEVKQAQWIRKERERIFQDAQAEAEKILEEAKTYVMKKASQDEIVKKAQEKAENILREAELSSKEMEEKANQYAYDVLKRLETNLERATQAIKEGQKQLSEPNDETA